MSFSLLEKEDTIQVGQFSIFPQKGLEHAISTRFGGVSKAPFDKMNLAMHNGDDKKSVLENRNRFCNAFFLSSANLCTCEQVHSSNIMQVTAADAGRGATSYEDAIKTLPSSTQLDTTNFMEALNMWDQLFGTKVKR